MEFLRDKHIKYIQGLDERRSELRYWLSAHLRLSGLYWGLTACHLMGEPDALDRDMVVAFVHKCWDDKEGAFAAHPDHDAHILYTLSAIQILVLENALDTLSNEKRQRVVDYVVARQHADGSIEGDKWGEIDTRFAYTAVQTLALLGSLDSLAIDPLVTWLSRCQNFDGGFGLIPGAESHAAQTWTALGSLAILGRIGAISTSSAAWWLADRQTLNGGLNGRPEKLPDVCYSWWALSSLAIMDRINWVDGRMLRSFILAAQDPDNGGIADREGDEADVFHTLFGIAGLSLLGYENLEPVSPIFCLPMSVMDRVPAYPGKSETS